MNSIKHAFPDGRTGEIKVSLRELAGGGGVLEIVDNGRGMPGLGTPADDDSLERTPEGLGAKIATLLSRQFGGSIAYLPANSDLQWPGTRVRIELPEIQLVASKELVGEMA